MGRAGLTLDPGGLAAAAVLDESQQPSGGSAVAVVLDESQQPSGGLAVAVVLDESQQPEGCCDPSGFGASRLVSKRWRVLSNGGPLQTDPTR